MAAALEITSEDIDTAVLVTVLGQVDHSNALQLRTAISEALQRVALYEPGEVVVVDLTQVTFLGPPGLVALVGGAGEAERLDRRFRVVVDEHRPPIRQIELTGLDRVLVLYHSVAEALALRL
jgi:anti-sigma B factor antagonist